MLVYEEHIAYSVGPPWTAATTRVSPWRRVKMVRAEGNQTPRVR
jgi:hypothetical protein